MIFQRFASATSKYALMVCKLAEAYTMYSRYFWKYSLYIVVVPLMPFFRFTVRVYRNHWKTLAGAHNTFFSTFTGPTRSTFHISLPAFCPFPLSLLLFAFPLSSFLYSNLIYLCTSFFFCYCFHEISIYVSSSVSFSILRISLSSLLTMIRFKVNTSSGHAIALRKKSCGIDQKSLIPGLII